MDRDPMFGVCRLPLAPADPEARIDDLLKRYSPHFDREIRQLLFVLFIDRSARLSGRADLWAPLRTLLDFWRTKIDHHLAFAWDGLHRKTLAPAFLRQSLTLISSAVAEARDETAAIGKSGYFTGSESDYRSQLDLIGSMIDDPLSGNAVRFATHEYDDRAKAYRRSVMTVPADDPGHDLKDVSPEPVIPDDDLYGQMFRDMGLIFCAPIGRVAIGDWQFPVLESEDKQYGVPVEIILAEFGGCPYGRNSGWYPGYIMKEKRCCCHLANICFGRHLLSAGTLRALAKRLRTLYENRDLRFLPGYRAALPDEQ